MSKSFTRERIQAELINVLVEQLDVPAEKITPSSSFRDDLGIDSLDVVEMLCEVEQRFDVTVPEQDLVKLVTVNDMINYLVELVSQTPSPPVSQDQPDHTEHM